MKPGDKLYVLTRSNLSPGQQAVQSCHALRQFVAEHPEVDNDWFNNSNYLALLCVSDESELQKFVHLAAVNDIPCSLFLEPDMNNALTAIALAPSKLTQRLCKNLQKTLC